MDGQVTQVTKQTYRENNPKRIKELRFGVLSSEDVISQSVAQIVDRHLYDVNFTGPRTITRNGALDPRLGTSNATDICKTCNKNLKECTGHFGTILLALPVFHVGFLKKVIEVLNCICKQCCRSLLEEKSKIAYLERLRRPNLDQLERKAIVRRVLVECKKARFCPHCASANGTVRKVPGQALKLGHDKYRWYNASQAKNKRRPKGKTAFDRSFEEVKRANPDMERHIKKIMHDLTPLSILNMFRKVSSDDSELMGMLPVNGRPASLIVQSMPVAPVTIRPSVSQDSASTEDDITNKIADILQINSILHNGIQCGQPLPTLMEQWDYLQIQVAMLIHSEYPGLQPGGYSKPMRGFTQRLKGKQGRFRGHLSGKRVDYSGRTVISPDPNLSIDEVAVPTRVAMQLTYPERATVQNLKKLRELIANGPRKFPGANFVQKQGGLKLVLFILANHPERLRSVANNLQVGDVVDRHLENGDIVLFNRQPSLHKLSIMGHRVRVSQHRTFCLNECVCTPYNADFDGDEMNLHVPQTEEARAEALELMSVKHNLVTPKDGTPIIAATQDFVTAAYLLSNKDRFFTRAEFCQICCYILNADSVKEPTRKRYREEVQERRGHMDIDLPPPTILKPQALWTGKQVFNVLMRPSYKSKILVNLDAPGRQFQKDASMPPDLDMNDGWVCIRNSEVMCGRMDKNIMGAGKKDSIFYAILRDYGPDSAVDAMNRLARLSSRWLSQQGFSIGVDDVYAGDALESRKAELIATVYKQCDGLIERYGNGTLGRDAGCDEAQTLEHRISGLLNRVRQDAGKLCFASLSKWNSAVTMARCGSKGSDINVSQMVAAVGQQIIGNQRVADGFEDRTLPHFPKASRQPPSKGFVQSSFFSGLNLTEFLFHAMSGREGIVDTAVKTAETGYMSRRLMKSLEDLGLQYDTTVRNASKTIAQFASGEDGLDPADMEGNARPVNFERTFVHSVASKWSNNDPSLLPAEIIAITHNRLAREKTQLIRRTLLGQALRYKDNLDADVDQYDSRRAFLNTVEEFVIEKAKKLARARAITGAPSITKYTAVAGLKAGKRHGPHLASGPPKRTKRASKGSDSASIPAQKTQRSTSSWTWYKSSQFRRIPELSGILDRITKRPASSSSVPADNLAKVSRRTLDKFLELCLTKYERAKVQPGHAVGAVGAQSIGEPGTQMTLKTFHFAGVAGMSITKGVPRIREIINASRKISTPIIYCELVNKNSEYAARLVRGRIEKAYLDDVLSYIDEVWTPDKASIKLQIDLQAIQDLNLEITPNSIRDAIYNRRGVKLQSDQIRVIGSRGLITITFSRASVGNDHPLKSARRRTVSFSKATKRSEALLKSTDDTFFALQTLKRVLPKIPIAGLPDATRAIITKTGKRDPKSNIEQNRIVVEGYGLKDCMTTPGVDGLRTTSNSVLAVFDVLGVEAARTSIIRELQSVLGEQMDIDPRHMQLLADVMTSRGEVLGITRFGLAKMRDSVLQLASFEKTADHLFEAAVEGKRDGIEGVSECIILGREIGLGTGMVRAIRGMGWDAERDAGGGATAFDAAYAEDRRLRKASLQFHT